MLIFFQKLAKTEQPIVVGGINIDELIVAEAQRIIADNDGSATTPQLMDQGITKVLYEYNVLIEEWLEHREQFQKIITKLLEQ